MKRLKIHIAVLGIVAALFSCTEEVIEIPLTANTIVFTRFMNSDSVTILNGLITDMNSDIELLSAKILSTQTDIDSLKNNIAEEPESEFVAIWEENIAKLTTAKTQDETTVSSLESQNTTFNNKRDSLNQGYSTLKSVTNILTGETVVLDTLLTTYRLPLDFKTSEAQYLIEVNDKMNQITLSYTLDEVISIDGKVTVVANDLTVTQNDFNSLTINDEDLYIFHF